MTGLFKTYGPVTEVFLPKDRNSGKSIGIAYVCYMLPEHAIKALKRLDGTIFQGRLLHLIPSRPKPISKPASTTKYSKASYKTKKDHKLRQAAESCHNWNTLFLGVNTIADVMKDRYAMEKRELFEAATEDSVAVRLALGETQIVAETKDFLEKNGVVLDALQQTNAERSDTVIIVKNIPFDTTPDELLKIFSSFGTVSKVILPPHGVSAVVEFQNVLCAKNAFAALAYSKFKHMPLYLEWAPVGLLAGKGISQDAGVASSNSSSAVVFVRNINFKTSEAKLRKIFSTVGGVQSVVIARNSNSKGTCKNLSTRYGFVTFSTMDAALQAITKLQSHILDGHKLVLKISCGHSEQTCNPRSNKKCKLLVRNIPFEATKSEVMQLFHTFGELKHVRLPLKINKSGHRGFGFVEFINEGDALKAYRTLSHSTHLYGRRLVLDWAGSGDTINELRTRTNKYFSNSPRKTKVEKDLILSIEK